MTTQQLEELTAQNEAKAQYLRANGIPVPTDQMYVTSLLEYLVLDALDDAKLYHEQRIAPILDRSVERLQILAQQAAEAQAQAELDRASEERRAVLLGHPI